MTARVRHWLHCVVAAAAFHSGLISAARRVRGVLLRRNEVTVIGLHRVLTVAEERDSASPPGMIMRQETFAALLEYIRSRYQLFSLAQMGRGSVRTNRPRCVITFDDGWSDNYSRALSLLVQEKVPASVFLATGFIGTGRMFWVEQVRAAFGGGVSEILPHLRAAGFGRQSADLQDVVEFLKRMPAQKRQELLDRILTAERRRPVSSVDRMLTWDQVREMAAAGIEFASHTVSHPLLTYEDTAVVEQELRDAKLQIEEQTGQSVAAFAYPNGDWDERIRSLVQKAGYRCAFTTQSGAHDLAHNPFAIRRTLLHEGNVTGWNGKFSPAMLEFTLTGWR